ALQTKGPGCYGLRVRFGTFGFAELCPHKVRPFASLSLEGRSEACIYWKNIPQSPELYQQ
ncbi:MAG: hypothetical protein NXI24_25075, partial [bacterium]|nr:hypothetical protein [bacterium]